MTDDTTDYRRRLAEAAGRLAGRLACLIDPDQVVELRALKMQDGSNSTLSGTFLGTELEKLAAAALEVSGHCQGVYFTLNPLKPDRHVVQAPRLRRASAGEVATDADVLSRRWILVDIDPVRAKGHEHDPATDDEKAAAMRVSYDVRAWLADNAVAAPIVADSGNGYHLFYRLAEPIPVTRVPLPEDDTVRLGLMCLAARFNTPGATIDTRVYNPGRVVRLPGTLSCKGTASEDRPHRRARILEVPDANG